MACHSSSRARHSDLRVELTCLHYVSRFDHRVLSSKRYALVQKCIICLGVKKVRGKMEVSWEECVQKWFYSFDLCERGK